ncbi:N-acetylglucosamine-6-phosphate deacetylase [Fodinicola acaciae]|uniref:N-acetylglucosamine-6-phosphate deacetylase n=1 Tax=Fodinicola acaciae TaxID=2681555 RepID=UPI0013D077BC|nr:N-acetylglucosamine-6-phosphate deacetylase [Fodinicola acaciae]
MTVLSNARLVLPDRVVEAGWLRIDGDRIAEIGEGPADGVDLGGRWLTPGLIDIHVHGGNGAAFNAAEPKAVQTVTDFHRSFGTTSMLGGLVTGKPDDMRTAAAVVADSCDAGELAGIYLEGPFLNVARKGAHDPELLRMPDVELMESVLEAGRGHVRQVTIAPELPGGLDLIKRCADHGVVTAVGHTDGSYEDVRAGFDSGASMATHLFNGMRPLHHRDPGPIAASMAAAGAICEVIADGVHLAPGTVDMLFATLGADRIALVTDAMSAAGVGDGEFQLGHLKVHVVDGVARLENGSIASSTATLAQVVARTVGMGVAFTDAVRAATLTPARLHNLSDVGAISTGLRADLVVWDENLDVAGVVRAGRWIREI